MDKIYDIINLSILFQYLLSLILYYLENLVELIRMFFFKAVIIKEL
jgi:hypothetical protein